MGWSEAGRFILVDTAGYRRMPHYMRQATHEGASSHELVHVLYRPSLPPEVVPSVEVENRRARSARQRTILFVQIDLVMAGFEGQGNQGDCGLSEI